MFFKSGDKYIGYFKDRKRNGHGTFFKRNGEIQKEMWKDNNFIN